VPALAMSEASTVDSPANKLKKSSIRPVQQHELAQFLVSSAAHKPNVQGHRLQEDNNIHLSSYPITSSPKMMEPFSLTSPEGLTCGGFQFQRVEPERCHILNFSCLDSLIEAKDALSPSVQMKTSALDNKRTNYPETYWYKNYYSQCSLICTLDQSISTHVCFCGLRSKTKSGQGKAALCNKPRLCMHCARRNVQNSLKTFLPNFHHHNWGFLTISYSTPLRFTHTSGSDWWLC
jgi:hypothetical protein